MTIAKVWNRTADTLWMSPISSTAASAVLAGAAGGGLAAISLGGAALDQEAQQIADPNAANVTSALVSATHSLQLAQAGADMISASNQMLGTILDIFA